MNKPIELEVAIVGGGIAGLYSAWRLTGPDRARSRTLTGAGKVGLFELSSRLGGRIYSVVPEGMEHLRAEAGAMRYFTNQAIVTGLIDDLSLETRPFFSGPRENLYYLPGRRMKLEDFAHPDRVPYHLEPHEQGRLPADLLKACLRDVVELKGTSAAAFLAMRKKSECCGYSLSDMGMWNLLLHRLSVDAVNLIRDAAGHDARLGNHNAAEFCALYLRHSLCDYEVRTMVEGMQALPMRLGAQVEKAGGEVFMNHRLCHIDPPGAEESRFRLVFQSQPDHQEVHCLAEHVVLAMPRRSFDLLDPSCYFFRNARFVADLESVVPMQACKIFLGYPTPWWRKLGIRSGRSDTDLPMRQCYYFGTEGECPGADPENLNSLLMAGYNDGASVDFWEGFLDRPLTDSPYAHQLGAPEGLVKEVHRQVRMLHYLESIPEPYTGMFIDWVDDPYGGGYHLWRLHSRSWEVMRRLRQPDPSLNLYVCGEAWSSEQGWIEGALLTAEQVLDDKFGLPRPNFLSREHQLVD